MSDGFRIEVGEFIKRGEIHPLIHIHLSDISYLFFSIQLAQQRNGSLPHDLIETLASSRVVPSHVSLIYFSLG